VAQWAPWLNACAQASADVADKANAVWIDAKLPAQLAAHAGFNLTHQTAERVALAMRRRIRSAIAIMESVPQVA
jgi:hypothetical protein